MVKRASTLFYIVIICSQKRCYGYAKASFLLICAPIPALSDCLFCSCNQYQLSVQRGLL